MHTLQLHSLLPRFCCLFPQLFLFLFFSPWLSLGGCLLFACLAFLISQFYCECKGGLRLIAKTGIQTRKTPFLQSLSWPLIFRFRPVWAGCERSQLYMLCMLQPLLVTLFPLLLLHVSGCVWSSTVHNKTGSRWRHITLLESSLFFLHLCMLVQNFLKLSPVELHF